MLATNHMYHRDQLDQLLATDQHLVCSLPAACLAAPAVMDAYVARVVVVEDQLQQL
jgi:hypothetical protein